MTKNIWLINHYAVRNKGRHASLAKQFVEQGWHSCIILSSFDHHKREYLYEESVKVVKNEDGVNYVYIHSKPAYTNNGAKRILNMLSFCWIVIRNLKYIILQVGKPDYVIASSVHPFVWEIGYKICKKYKARFVAEVRDIWPLSLVEVAHVNPKHPFVKVLSIVERRAYVRSDAIVTTMPYAYKHICENFPVKREKVHWMPNGIDVRQYDKNLNSKDPIPQDLDEFLTKHWCCVYTGSFVESECISMMLDAFSILKDQDIYFAIVGGGHDEAVLKQRAKELGLNKVTFFPYMPQAAIAKVLSKAKCCIAASHNLPIYQYGFSTNKHSDYLLSGNPVIFASDYPNVVKNAGHFGIPSDSPNSLANAIMEIKGLSPKELAALEEKGKNIIKELYDYNVVAKNYLKLLSSLN